MNKYNTFIRLGFLPPKKVSRKECAKVLRTWKGNVKIAFYTNARVYQSRDKHDTRTIYVAEINIS